MRAPERLISSLGALGRGARRRRRVLCLCVCLFVCPAGGSFRGPAATHPSRQNLKVSFVGGSRPALRRPTRRTNTQTHTQSTLRRRRAPLPNALRNEISRSGALTLTNAVQVFSIKCFPASVFRQVCSVKCFPSSVSVKCFPSNACRQVCSVKLSSLLDSGVFRSIGI